MGIRLHDKPALKLEIILGLAWARLLVRFVPFAWWRDTVGPIGACPEDIQQTDLTNEQARTAVGIGRVVARIANVMPFDAACLPRAMTARWMLQRRKIPSRLMVGSKRGTDDGSLKFHAWLVCGNDIVTGGEVSAEYHVFGASRATSE
ncbi:lasso peptide biosynthesis B2 protein [Porphyrobacter sp. AAP60]|uniref:lasso peptide biosynthesis B2 protein n=1 Tax=Porphyrobacter sp. AAP60 TaxID=1523423 RepID=UPI0006B8FA7F|nr:lasso peptide biosynthesis B2 protein [Porphyrobacter sp. AAP60]